MASGGERSAAPQSSPHLERHDSSDNFSSHNAMDMIDSGSIKRIRQACANCRRKKTKCTGDRPICSHCRRNHLACVYEPYSATLAENPPATNPAISLTSIENNLNNVELLQRISTIESRLAALSGQTTQENIPSHFSLTQDHVRVPPDATFSQWLASPRTFQDNSSLPPPQVLRSVIDTYFLRVHNQPYSYFQERSFRQKLETNSLPRCLILAVLSSAVRFSNHEFYANQTREASQKYARESWLSVLADHLTMEDNLNVYAVQTVNLLAVVDYTAGRARSGWLKIGLAARISQDLHLMSEPDQCLSYAEQEEHRRAFWSIYLLDKLISCGRYRPLVLLDEDCEVQLPCDEHTFRHGEWRKTNTIGQLLNWNSKLAESPSPFALVVLMASIFGRCTRYVHQSRKMDEVPPWDPKSEFSAINSSLLLLESYSKSSNWQLSDVLHGSVQADGTVDRQEIGHIIFAHTIFHLCHCLLNHPFLVRRWLRPFGAKAPASFSSRALQDGCDHAKQLMDLLQQATDHGCLVESSFYAYCIAVAGGIHSLATHFHRSKGQESNNLHYLQRSLDSLERLAKLWAHAGNIATSLREFHSISHAFAILLDPSCLMDDLDSGSEEIMWSMIDYAIMGADPSKRQLSPKSTANIPSPTSWVLGAGILGQPGYDSPNGNILGGLTPSMRLEEVEQYLNFTPGTNNMI